MKNVANIIKVLLLSLELLFHLSPTAYEMEGAAINVCRLLIYIVTL